MFGKFRADREKARQAKIAPQLADQSLRDFEEKIYETLLPDYATDEIWDDQYQANYLDPIRALTDSKVAIWNALVADFKGFQEQVSRQVRAAGLKTSQDHSPAKIDPQEFYQEIMSSVTSRLDLKRKFRELDRDGVQQFYVLEVGQLLQYLRLDSSIADRPSDTVERKGLQAHEANSFIIDRVCAIIDLMELGCLTHFSAHVPRSEPTELEVDFPWLRSNDMEAVRTEYPLLKEMEKLDGLLRDLVKREAELFNQTYWLQVSRDSAHALYSLFQLHKFPHDVSYRFYDSDHQRLLYPTTILPKSQTALSFAGICSAVRHITKSMSSAQAAMFLQTLTYLVVSAMVLGTKRARIPGVAAFAYVQAAERGMGIELLSTLVDRKFADQLKASFESLKLEWNEQSNDLAIAERFRAAKALLPGKPNIVIEAAAEAAE